MTSNSSNNNFRIAKNTAFLYLRMLFVLVANLYITRAVLKSLGVVDYGIYNVVAGFVTMFAFLNTSMSIAIQRFFNFEKGSGKLNTQSAVYNSALVIQLIIGITTLVLLESFGIWYVNNVMVIPIERIFVTNFVFQFSALSLFVVIMQVPYSAAIMAYERMDFYAIVGVIDVIFRHVAVISLPFVSFDKLNYYGALVASVSLIDIACYYIYVNKNFPNLVVNFHSGKRFFRPMFSFSVWNLLDMFAFTMKGQGLNVLLNGFFGPIVNAARGVAAQIMAAIQGFSSNIVTAFRPQLVESYAQGDYERTNSLMFGMSRISFGLLYILTLPIFLEIDYVLSIWLDGNVPQYTPVFTKLVLIDMLVNSLNTPLSQVVQAVGKLKTYQIIRSFVVLSILPISWFALKSGADPTIVFVVSITISLINQPVSMYLLRRVYAYSYNDYLCRVILPCILLILFSIPIPIIVQLYFPQGIYRFFLIIGISVAICLLLSFFLMLSKMQRSELSLIIKKLYHSLLSR